MSRFFKSICALSLLLGASIALAEDIPEDAPAQPSTSIFESFHPFDLRLSEPKRPRNTFWPPIASVVLPGFDQWWEGQNSSAIVYSGTALGGLALAASAHAPSPDNSSAESQLQSRDDRVRSLLLGLKIYETAGELSAYHSFRSAVRTRQENGEYLFLPKTSEESPDTLLLAPFHFSFLERPTTFIPLGVLLAGVIAAYTTDNTTHSMQISDFFFSTSNSYCAGVGEEALFRGYMMPRLMYSFDNRFWSNTTTALIFGAAHIASDNQVPIAQAVFGWYMGWLSQSNQWTISEGIFLHAWWDALILVYDSTLRSQARPMMMPIVAGTF